MKKSKFAVLLALLLVVTSVVGCTSSNNENGDQASNGEVNTPTEVSYPEKSIDFIIPYTAGGGTDSLMRLMATAVEEELGQSIIISNVAGGGGQVGITQLYNAKSDGYTIGAVTDSDQYITILTGENVAYDKDSFKYIGAINTSCNVIMASKNSGFNSVDDLVAYAKEHPGEVTIGVSGQVHTLDVGKLSQAAGIQLTPIMHDGAADSFSSGLGGQVDAIVIDKKFVAQAEGQDITVLASFGGERLESIEDVPTMKELGYDIESSSCRLILVPGDTPDEIVSILADSIEKATNTDEFKASMKNMSEVYKLVLGDEINEQVQNDYESIKQLLEANPDILG